MNKSDNSKFNILIIEDNFGDVDLIKEAFKSSPIDKTIHTVKDGVEALLYLRKHFPYEKSETPDLIFLDLNMPKKDGREVLLEMRVDQKLKAIPVIVFTTSQSDQDIVHSYDYGANCFITKPFDLGRFNEVIVQTLNYWLTTVSLPPK